MSSVNKVILLGRLGADPEIIQAKNNTIIARLSLATSKKYKDESGNLAEKTQWHKVTFFKRRAEICQSYLRKGSLIYIEGELRTDKYLDKSGVEKYQTYVVGQLLTMVGSKSETGSPQQAHSELKQPHKAAPAPKEIPSKYDGEDDIPF